VFTNEERPGDADSALRSMSEPGARLDFFLAGGKPRFTGQIRI
jgi:hypothetical protein